MKRALLLVALLAYLPIFAQSGFSLQPSAGVGLTNARLTESTIFTYPKQEAILGYSASLGLGYRFNQLRLSTGLTYLHCGSKTSSNGFTINDVYNHLLVPLTAGYAIPITQKLSFVPELGAAFSYNLFDNPSLKRTSIWGLAKLKLEMGPC